MKKLFFAFVAILANYHLVGQVSIQSKHMPSAGDTARLSISSPLNLPSSWDKRGSNISWDFSKLTPLATQLREFKSSFRTPYAFYFLNRIGEKTQDTRDLGPLSFTNIYSFYMFFKKNKNLKFKKCVIFCVDIKLICMNVLVSLVFHYQSFN